MNPYWKTASIAPSKYTKTYFPGNQMTNNDILFKIKNLCNFNNEKMIEIFASAEQEVSLTKLEAWLLKNTDEGAEPCDNANLESFLNGFINEKRGKKDGPQPELSEKLTRNIIFRKLKIALDLQADDLIEIFELVEVKLSKHEISAFFRKPGNKHYKECKKETLESFLQGMALKLKA